jgi:hypothetical protein
LEGLAKFKYPMISTGVELVTLWLVSIVTQPTTLPHAPRRDTGRNRKCRALLYHQRFEEQCEEEMRRATRRE